MTQDVQELLKINEKLETEIAERKRAEEQLARYTEELHYKNAQMEAELHLAREIQQAFLPQQYPTFPRTAASHESALHFHHRYFPTVAVGGDFFDVLALSDTEAGVFICDVMGHGVRAALVTAMLRALLEEWMPIASDPGQFLSEINHGLLTLLKRTRTPMFVSAFYFVVDLTSGQLRYANAGHPSPLHVRRDAGEVMLLSSADCPPGPALGVFEDAAYFTCESRVEVRDLVMLFTDGLFEVAGGDGEDYEQERLLAAVRDRLGLPSARLFDELLSEIQQFSSKHEFEDDVCLVGMEVARTGLHVKSVHDPLTGLFNRSCLDESLDREIHRAERNGRSVGIIKLNIDDFNHLNNTLGHEAGDELLRGLGSFLLTHTRRSDLACRYDGGDLVLIMPEASLDSTRRKAEQIREAVRELNVTHPSSNEGSVEPVTISMGVAVFPNDGGNAEAVLRAADTALHRAKRAGRGQIVVAQR